MKLLKNIFIYSHLAWIWLFLLLIHIGLTNYLAAENVFLFALNHIVFLSSFLVYSVDTNLQTADKLFVLFAMQFSFWLMVSLINVFFIKQVSKYANRR